MDQEKLDAAFSELDYEDDLEIKVLISQTEVEHLKSENYELRKLLNEYDLRLRHYVELIAKIHMTTIT
jgi:hypothetical protein